MKIFPGWRAVGAAMRWARQQDGVQRSIIVDYGRLRHAAWERNDADFVALSRFGAALPGVTVHLAGGLHLEADGLAPSEALRVLAVLDLIPAELAEVADA